MGIGGCGGGESNNVRNTSLHTYMCVYTYAAVSAQKSSIDGLVTPMDSKVYMYSQCIHANTQTRTYILCTPKTHHELPYRNTLQHPATRYSTLHLTATQQIHTKKVSRSSLRPVANTISSPPPPCIKGQIVRVLASTVAVCCSVLQ